MSKLNELLKALGEKIQQADLSNPKVSQGAVSWHIEHALLVVDVITEAMKRSNPAEYKGKFTFSRAFVFASGKIPRGRIKAPKSVFVEGARTQDQLHRHLVITLNKVDELYRLEKNHHFPHPIFGNMNLKNTVRFLEIHTKHHMKIINDIIAASR